MKRLLLTCLLLLLPSYVTDARVPDPSPATSILSVVKVYHDDSQGFNHQCTGFAINPTTYITARHCLGDDLGGDVDIVHGLMRATGTVVGRDDKNDLILISSDRVLVPGIPICREPPAPGEFIYVIGFPFDMEHLIMYVGPDLGEDHIFNYGVKRWVGTTIYSGMSGGPMVTSSGCVVSVNQLAYPSLNLSFGATFKSLKALTSR